MADVAYQAGWYPDPVGRFEFRFHNGAEWTADVSTDGVRYVDPLGVSPALPAEQNRRRRNSLGIAAMIIGIISVTIAWVPFVVVVGAVCAVVAIILGILAMRRVDSRGFAIAGILTGALGLALCVVGVVFSLAVLRAVDSFENPADHEARLTSCELDGILATATGDIQNLSDESADFTVTVLFLRPGTDNAHRSERVIVDDVEANATVLFEISSVVRLDDVACEIGDVSGPLPFGLDVQT